VLLCVLLLVAGCSEKVRDEGRDDDFSASFLLRPADTPFPERLREMGFYRCRGGGNGFSAHSIVYDLPITHFPKPHQGPKKISDDCWLIKEGDKLPWRKIDTRLRRALWSVGLESRVWTFGGSAKPNSDRAGFAILSERHYMGAGGKKSKDETSFARQFVLVVCPDIVPITNRPASKEEFQYYFEQGSPHLPDEFADSKFVDLSESGDHLYLLVYSWEAKPLSKGLHQVAADQREHYVASGLKAALEKLRGSAAKDGGS
jgi:hypothetical protein